jgi:Copper type II ascorbate-dependent monooxygenase, C-terminal domain
VSRLVPALTALLLGCAPAAPTWHSDVEPIVQARCQSCHVEGGIAPFALTTYAQAQAMAPAIAAAVSSGSMPPWRAGEADVTYLRNPQLSVEQKDAIVRWAESGTAKGDPAGKQTFTLAPVGGGMERVDTTVKVPEPYTPRQLPDDYRCFPVRWPETVDKFITGFDARPDVAREVHHIAIYQVDPGSADLPFQWDAEEAGPGYTCFGGPFGDHPQQFAVNVLGAWIPGSQGFTNPRGMGIAIPPGSTLVLQMHYYVADGAPEPDATSVQFQLADQVDKVAAYQPFLDVGWIAGGLAIPPNASNAMFQHVADPRPFFELLGSPLDTSKGFNIEGVMFHMHKLGKVGELYLEKAGGGRVKVLHIPDWNFHWQQQYMLEAPVRFEPGDKLRLRCTFDNTPGRSSPDSSMREVRWGEGSDDEMCVANILSSE